MTPSTPVPTFVRRLPVLLLAAGLASGAMAVVMPTDAQAMVKHECLYDVELGSNSTNDPLLCN